MRLIIRFLAASTAALVLAACGRPEMDPERLDYPERLKLPPDLTAQYSDAMGVPEVQRGRPDSPEALSRTLLPDPAADVRVQRAGGQRWLELQAAPEDVWEWLQQFLEVQDIPVAEVSPPLGLVETEWLEGRVDAGRGVFTPVTVDEAGDGALAERFRFRLEPVDGGTSELHVAHSAAVREDERWRWRPSDSFAEAEVLRGFMVYLGLRQTEAARQLGTLEATPRARLDQDDEGRAVLLLDDEPATAWRRTGLALDQLGFTVDDRDRSAGEYLIRYDPHAEEGAPERGFLDRFAFWREDEPEGPQPYRLLLESRTGGSQLVVETVDGAPIDEDLAQRLLALLSEQMR
ncbi:outer membrane protein assembly factor BamC [Alkalilimnicola ehrlichii MLHE-1]|uniref:NlpBDapX lipoprotein n=1 Tax=Alkalilimnicola ehrlichii (strain ATCC BAA-1101 / DSM 17681 / MLHE-1) TaxID=187272 RepID=Q0A5S2_ALKEH|nr:outer membrane protein assembly factor BamC [Alkalilimnicola ehrlichii]ABI57815.1 NlpBDapX lipoprotein [Alkalilimnicola ehrlichii MLHE-1]